MKKAAMRISNISQFLIPFLLLVLLAPQVSAQAQIQRTWTFTPELRRLTELPGADNVNVLTADPAPATHIGSSDTVNVPQSDTIYVGLYVNAEESLETGQTTLGEIRVGAVAGAIGFSGTGLTDTEIHGLIGAAGATTTPWTWYRGMELVAAPPNVGFGGFAVTDLTIGTTPANLGFLLGVPLQARPVPTPARCVPDAAGRCEIFIGAFELPLAGLPGTFSGALTLTATITNVDDFPDANAIRTEVVSGALLSVEYNVCPAAGCPVSVAFGEAEYPLQGQPSFLEGSAAQGGTQDVTVELSGALTQAVDVPITTTGAITAPSMVTFAIGTTAQTITVTATGNDDDAAGAPPETTTAMLSFGTTLPASVSRGSPATTTLTITDDDDPALTVDFNAGTYNVSEGGTTTVEVVLTLPSGATTTERAEALTINIMPDMPMGDAVENTDYRRSARSVTFPANAMGTDLTQPFTITRDDDAPQTDTGSLRLSFGTPLPAGVTAGTTNATATVNLLDDDGQGVALAVDQSSIAEGTGTANTIVVTATLTSAMDLGADLVVDLAWMNGTAEDADYNAAAALPDITFSSGATSGSTQTANITLTPVNDTIVEPDETIMLGGTATTTAPEMFGVTPVTITLTDADTATLTISAPSGGPFMEGMDTMFTLTHTGVDMDIRIIVAWSGTGVGDASGTVSLDHSMTTQMFPVRIPDDRVAQASQMFTVTLGAITGQHMSRAMLGSTTSAMVAVTDNDNIVVTLTGPGDVQRGQRGTYMVNLVGSDGQAVTGSADVTAVVMLSTDDANDADTDDFNFATGDNIAIDSADDTMATVTVPMGQSSQSFDVEFPMQDAAAAQEAETLILELGTVTGGGGVMQAMASATDNSVTTEITVGLNPDQAAEVVTGTLLGVGRIISSNMLGAIDARASASLASGPSQVTLAGKTFSEDMVRSLFSNQYQDQDGDHSNHELLNNLKDLLGIRLDESNGVSLQPVSVRELLTNSSFELSLNGKKKKKRGMAAPGNTLSFWGRGAYGEYENQSDIGDNMNVNIDGDTLSGQLGIDYRFGEWLTGVALNYTDGSSDFTDDSGRTDGAVNTELYSVHPYVHYSPANSPLASWLMLGYGKGDVGYSEGNRSGDGDIDMLMLAAGLTYKLASTNNIDWSLKTNGFFAKFDVDQINARGAVLVAEHDSDVTQLRMAVSAGISNDLGGGDKFNANFDVGGRFDGGDAEEGAGAEIAGGLNYVSGSAGLDLAAEGRFLVAHEESNFDEWGASVSLRFDPGIRKHGFQLSMLPAWGNSSSGVDTLYESKGTLSKGVNDSVLQHSDDDDPEMRMETRIAYGFPILRDDNLLTPYVEMENASQRSSLRLGKSLEIMTLKGMSFKSDVYGVQESHTGDQGFVIDSRLERGFARDFATLSLFGKLQSGDIAEDEDYQIGVELNSKF